MDSIRTRRDPRSDFAHQSQIAGVESDPDINQRYIHYLSTDKRYDQVLTHAREYMESGAAIREAMKPYLKQAYRNTHHSLGGYDAFLTAVRAAQQKHRVGVLKGQTTDKPAPDFSLKDLEGNEVPLHSFRGKIVVLDFWATWCGPCIASFSAMQKAVDQYRDDDGVKFLFVNTWEDGEDAETRKKQVLNFVAQHPYGFHIVMDEKNPRKKGRRFQVADAYGIDGIPARFVISPAGKIRFTESGYGGSESALLEEIEAMVGLVRGRA